MAETLIQQIKNNAGKQWSRNTVADGNWLNSNTVQKFNENDETLARAIDGLSAEMEHFTPEITPSAWDCESKQTIKSLRQASDGHLEVELQPIDFGETTLSDKVWAYLHQTGFKQVVNQYQDITVGSGSSQDYGFNLVAGELTDNTLSLQAGIYDIKIELLYNTSQSPVEHIVKVGLFLDAVSENPIIEDHCYFNDSYTIENDVAQVRWLNFTIKVGTASLLKIGVTSPDGAIGQVCANKVLIMSAGGATGAQGEPGPQGPNGISPTVNVTDITGGKHIVISGADGEHPFDIMNGASGKSPMFRINDENAHWQWKYDDQSSNWADVPNTPTASGTKGDNGYSPIITIDDTVTGQHTVSIQDATHTDSFIIKDGKDGDDGISPTVSTSVITGGNRVTFTYDDGGTSTTKSIDVMSGTPGTPGHTPVISMTSTDISRQSQGQTQNGTEVKFTIDGTDTTYSAWNGLDGAGSMSQVYTAGYVEGTGIDQEHAVQLTQEAVEAIEAVSGKVNKPATSLKNMYLVLRTDTNGVVSGWCDYNEKIYSKSECDDRYYTKTYSDDRYVRQAFIDNTLSGTGASADNKLGVNTNVIPTKDWLDDNYLPLSGGIVSGSTYFSAANGKNVLAVASAATLIGASRQTSAHFGTDNDAIGTTWVGVNGDGSNRGFLKYINGGNVGDLNGQGVQVEFGGNNGGEMLLKTNTSDPNTTTKVVNVPQSGYNNMSTFDATNGPNYMLRKLSDGRFDIGACVINVTDIPQNTEANTYYFVYDLV